MPGVDLNDTILHNFLQIFKTFMLPPEISRDVFIFNSYFITKLLKNMDLNECGPEVFSQERCD